MALIVEINSKSGNRFYLFDRWKNIPPLEITKENYSQEMPIEFLLLHSETLANDFISDCWIELFEDKNKSIIAKRLMEAFNDIDSSEYLGLLHRMTPLLILMTEFRLIESKTITEDKELINELKRIQEIEFDEQVLNDKYKGNFIEYLHDLVRYNIINNKIPEYRTELFNNPLKKYLENNPYSELTESDTEDITPDELTLEEIKALDYLLSRS